MATTKHLVTTIFLLSIACTALNAQNNVTVYLKERQAYTEIKVDSKSQSVSLKGQIDTLILVFPDDDFANYSLQVNKDSLRFYLSFACSGDSCELLKLSDIKERKLFLAFAENKLISVSGRAVKSEKPRQLVINKNKEAVLTIKSPVNLQKKPEKPEDIYAALTRNPAGQIFLPVDTTELKLYRFLCDSIITGACSSKIGDKYKKACCGEVITSPYNALLLKPCATDLIKRSGGNAVTPKYHIIVDTRSDAERPVTYLKYKNGKSYEYAKVKKVINPQAKKEILFSVIGDKDSTYVIDSSTVTYFMEYEKNFADALKGAEQPVSHDTTSKNGEKAEPPKKPTTPDEAAGKETPEALLQNAKYQKIIDEYNAAKKQLETFKTENDSLRKELSLLIKKIDSLKTEMIKLPASKLKTKLLALNNDLQELNLKYLNIDLREYEYLQQVICLRIKVAKVLGISVSETAADFAKSLISMVKPGLDTAFHEDFKLLIKQIESNYSKIVSKTTRFRVFTKQLQVPNKDELSVAVRTKNNTVSLMKRNFDISRGLKIDFSTGIFHSGITSSDFVLDNIKLSYKETRDTIVSGGRDSLMYTGRVVDTTSKIISENIKKSFSAGFMLHVYTRTGSYVNGGLAAGVILNQSQIQILLGTSLMFKAGSNRFALSFGFARGRQKTLSSELQKFQGQEITINKIYNSKRELPQFYTGTENINTYTFEKWKTSYFIGLTYNFASKNIGN